jgi:Na+-transporting methylmalonyl-CoA/oxaloacetate decarboxylase gamma subunit
MTVLDSFVVDGFGLSIVFAVLIVLSLVIKLISLIVSRFMKKNQQTNIETKNTIQPAESSALVADFADGELKLIDVDEKTAALIMAIVSDESEIPLSQLRFKSIRLL